MLKAWTDEAWEDYIYWQTQDKKNNVDHITMVNYLNAVPIDCL